METVHHRAVLAEVWHHSIRFEGTLRVVLVGVCAGCKVEGGETTGNVSSQIFHTGSSCDDKPTPYILTVASAHASVGSSVARPSTAQEILGQAALADPLLGGI